MKKFAKSPHTDENHLKILIIRLKNILSDENNLIDLYNNPTLLEQKLRVKPTDEDSSLNIPLDSRLPNELANFIKEHIGELFSQEEWNSAIYGKLSDVNEDLAIKIDNLNSNTNSFAKYLDTVTLPNGNSSFENRFHYENTGVGFYGRDNELIQIDKFLHCNKNMAIWAICGQGGTGKSKLARAICQRYENVFKIVWLKETDFSVITGIIGEYSYSKPILFVCDYADEKEEDLNKLMEKLYESNCTTRFLLLSRLTDWYKKFYKSSEITRECCYNPVNTDASIPVDLSMNSLTNDDYRNIFNDFRNSFYSSVTVSDDEITGIINSFPTIVQSNSVNQVASRCLFFLLLIDSKLDRQKIDLKDNFLDTIVDNYFTRTKNHLTNYNSTAIECGYRLLSLATACGEIDLLNDNIPDFIKKDVESIYSEFNNSSEEILRFFTSISDREYTISNGTIIVKPFEPDIIGEYLFLSTFDSKIIATPLWKEWCNYIFTFSYIQKNAKVKQFISRSRADWKEKGTVFFTSYQQFVGQQSIN